MKQAIQFLLVLFIATSPLSALTIIDNDAPEELRDNAGEHFNIDARDPITGDTFRALYHDHQASSETRYPYLIAQCEIRENNRTYYRFHNISTQDPERFIDDLRLSSDHYSSTLPSAVRIYKISSLKVGASAELIQRIDASTFTLHKHTDLLDLDQRTPCSDTQVILAAASVYCLVVLGIIYGGYCLFSDLKFECFKNGLFTITPTEKQALWDFFERLRQAPR